MTPSPRRVLAAVLATAAGTAVAVALPAAAHNARNTPAGAPVMDLEVMVTPEIEGRITPGGTDPLVSVDGFGNRFAVARKEDAQQAVGVDGRARTLTRASAWAWTSEDDGLTWGNLDVLPRGAEQLLPQGLSRDIASNGPLTVIVENLGATSLVHWVVATGRGQLTGSTRLSTNATPGTVGGDVAAATNGRDAVVAAAPQAGPTSIARVFGEGGLAAGPGVTLPGRCDVAADPRPATQTFWAACVTGGAVVLHQSRDAGATFVRKAAVASRGARAQVDVGPDGTPYVLSGLQLSRLTGGRLMIQDLTIPGEFSGASFAVSNKGRIAASSYYRAGPAASWKILTALFSPGARPVWYSFADHDPVDAAEVPATWTSVDTDPRGRLQLVWASTFLSSEVLDGDGARLRLRNVYAARSVTS